MKQLKIKQEFLDNIKSGLMNFYITKDNLGKDIEYIKNENMSTQWAKVELVSTTEIKEGCCKYIPNTTFCLEQHKLVVELKQTPMTAFDIGVKLILKDQAFNNFRTNRIMIEIEETFKQGDTLYWYDLRLVE